MLVGTHTEVVLRQGWAAVTASLTVWQQFLASQAYPDTFNEAAEAVSTSALLYTRLATAQTVTIDYGIIFGRAAMPAVYITPGNANLANERIGMNIRPTEVAWVEEQGDVTITSVARTRIETECLAIVMKGLMLRAKPKLCSTIANGGFNYINVQYAGSRQPFAMPDLSKEGFGAFQASSRWMFDRHSSFPPILEEPQAPAYLSIHAFDAVDQWGNHGKVRPTEE